VSDLVIREAVTPADRRAFVDLLWSVYRDDPAWIPPLKFDRLDLITPAKNPYFEHAKAKLWLAYRGERLVGRISAQVDQLVQTHMGAGTGQWGCLEADNDPTAATALLTTAEAWLKSQGMTRALGPFSLSVWDEPGLLVDGHDIPPLVMMGHHRRDYAALVEAAGHHKARDLLAYELDISKEFPEKIQRIVALGDANPKIKLRPVNMARFNDEVALILGILNDAWSDNWGFIPLTPAEIAHAAKGLKSLVNPQMIRVAEYEGEPVAFMITLPDLNHFIKDLNGSLFPLGWAKLLYRLKFSHSPKVRVPLMGVKKEHQSKRHGGLMVMMLIEHIRRYTHGEWGAVTGELSWILEDNLPMRNILEQIGCFVTKTYRIYEKTL
jgi:GNAT superfamily N-acetyltransferase